MSRAAECPIDPPPYTRHGSSICPSQVFSSKLSQTGEVRLTFGQLLSPGLF